MIHGDYIEKNRRTKSGKTVVDKIVKSSTGVEYAIGKKLGAGGVAKVYRAHRLRDNKDFVFKEYVPSPAMRKVHNGIKSNIIKLMQNPLMKEDGKTVLDSFVGPMDKDSLIELPASKGFGYVMELVDMNSFLPIMKLWYKDRYPDAEMICKISSNIAYLFQRIHYKGWCYKDINEGNIYINNKTGDVCIIDCDNISVQATKTIKGTDAYMAPEVYVTSTPDRYTDYFSMAVLFYRLFVGGYPMDGKKSVQYLHSKNLSVQEAAAEIYGKMALFSFDEKDRSNEIRGLVDSFDPKMYKIQTEFWDRLPREIQEGFLKTFSAGLLNVNRHKRTSDSEWITIFNELKQNRLVECSCGKMNFGEVNKNTTCIFCKATLPKIKPPKKLPIKPSIKLPVKQSPTTTAKTGCNGTQVLGVRKTELSTVVFKAKRDIAPTSLTITAKRKSELQGKAIYPSLNENWMKIQYNSAKNILAAVNQSKHTWIITDGADKKQCVPGGRVVLKKDLVITVLKKQLQLKVDCIQ